MTRDAVRARSIALCPPRRWRSVVPTRPTPVGRDRATPAPRTRAAVTTGPGPRADPVHPPGPATHVSSSFTTRNGPHRQARRRAPGAYRLVRTPPGSVAPLSWTHRSARWPSTGTARCWSSPDPAPARPRPWSRRSHDTWPGGPTPPASSCSPSAARRRSNCATGWRPGSAVRGARRPPPSTPTATPWSAPTRTPISSPIRCACSPAPNRTSPSASSSPASSAWSGPDSPTSAGPTNCGPA